MSLIAEKTENGKTYPDVLEGYKSIQTHIEKKIRNLEKKKNRLDEYQRRKSSGEQLNQQQAEALGTMGSVVCNLEFARELLDSVKQTTAEQEKLAKKAEKLARVEAERRELDRMQRLLSAQAILNEMGAEETKAEFKAGLHGPVLSDAQLSGLDDLYLAVTACREEADEDEKEEEAGQWRSRVENCARSTLQFLDAGASPVPGQSGMSFGQASELIGQLADLAYFRSQRIPKREQREQQQQQQQEQQQVQSQEEEEEVEVEKEEAKKEEEVEVAVGAMRQRLRLGDCDAGDAVAEANGSAEPEAAAVVDWAEAAEFEQQQQQQQAQKQPAAWTQPKRWAEAAAVHNGQQQLPQAATPAAAAAVGSAAEATNGSATPETGVGNDEDDDAGFVKYSRGSRGHRGGGGGDSAPRGRGRGGGGWSRGGGGGGGFAPRGGTRGVGGVGGVGVGGFRGSGGGRAGRGGGSSYSRHNSFAAQH